MQEIYLGSSMSLGIPRIRSPRISSFRRYNDLVVVVAVAKQLNEGRHASDRRSSTRRRSPAGITNPPSPLITGRRKKSARPLALGATCENISTSMTGTKCITRAHKRLKRVQKGSLKVSEMLQRTELGTALPLERG